MDNKYSSPKVEPDLEYLIVMFDRLRTPTKRELARKLFPQDLATSSLTKDPPSTPSPRCFSSRVEQISPSSRKRRGEDTTNRWGQERRLACSSNFKPFRVSGKEEILSVFPLKARTAAEKFDNNYALARYYSVDESNVRYWRKKIQECRSRGLCRSDRDRWSGSIQNTSKIHIRGVILDILRWKRSFSSG